MSEILNAFLKFKRLERIFLSLTLAGVVLKYIFRYTLTTEIIMFSIILLALYFPLGFLYIGKPLNQSYITSIILGFFYAIGIASLLYGVAVSDGFDVPLYIILFFFSIIIIFLSFKLKSNVFDKEYIYAQFIRITFILIANLVVCIW